MDDSGHSGNRHQRVSHYDHCGHHHNGQSYRLMISPPCEVSEYIVCKENRIDIQQGNECSGYAAAYLLRHYDIPADGTEIYQKMPFKNAEGCVPPSGIKKVLESYGFHVRYCAGNLNALKRELCKGAPVIVFIKSRKDKEMAALRARRRL